jgi:hypothetical protein
LIAEDLLHLGARDATGDLHSHRMRIEPHRSRTLSFFSRLLCLELAQRPWSRLWLAVRLGAHGLAPAERLTQAGARAGDRRRAGIDATFFTGQHQRVVTGAIGEPNLSARHVDRGGFVIATQ